MTVWGFRLVRRYGFFNTFIEKSPTSKWNVGGR